MLITVDGYRYNGKPIDVRGKLGEIARSLPSVQRLVMVPFLNVAVEGGFVCEGATRIPVYCRGVCRLPAGM